MKTAVVIPVYNQERHLTRCLKSLKAQTCRDFVVLAVDDGSTDSSATLLLQERDLADYELVMISRTNGGVSAARNTGLVAALAREDVDSVMFLDPDDRYLSTCIEKARKAHQATPHAVVEWAFATTQRPISSFTSPNRLEPNVWCKLYPREVVADVRFCEETNIAEDLAFNLEVEHRHHPSLVRIPEALYVYENNESSAMHRPLDVKDYERRAAVIRYIISVVEGDARTLDAVCRDEIPELLKQFYRDLKRVNAPDALPARAQFVELLRDLKARHLLHSKRGRLKDLKYYFKFCLLSRGGTR